MTIEEHNLKEEIQELLTSIDKSLINNDNCSVFRILHEEKFSPKGKAIILENNFYEKIVFDCNLCRACENNLDNNLCTAIQKARQIIVLQKRESKESREVLENLRRTGNIYGIE